jgi:3-hydroxyisobutyrate dehydrogenase
LTIYNRTSSKTQYLADLGAKVAASPGEAIAASALTVLMLKDAEAIRGLLFSKGAGVDLSGRTLLQMGTIAPKESLALMEETRKAGGDYLEAPVLGSRPKAREGKLLVMVGATREQFERWVELLRSFGPNPRLVGEVGKAAALKLAFNQLIASQLAAFSLSLGMVARAGIDVGLFMELLRQSALYAPTFDSKLPTMLERKFAEPNFPARLLLKDLDLIRAEAQALGLRATTLEGVREVIEEMLAMGYGDHDYSVLYQAIDPDRDNAGRSGTG